MENRKPLACRGKRITGNSCEPVPTTTVVRQAYGDLGSTEVPQFLDCNTPDTTSELFIVGVRRVSLFLDHNTCRHHERTIHLGCTTGHPALGHNTSRHHERNAHRGRTAGRPVPRPHHRHHERTVHRGRTAVSLLSKSRERVRRLEVIGTL